MADLAVLHSSASSAPIRAVSMFNEIVQSYPNAISLAPGAPTEEFATDLDIGACLAAYVAYTATRSTPPPGPALDLYAYGPPGGLINGIVADALTRDAGGGRGVATQDVVVTVGAQEAMLLVLRALVATADDVLGVVTPCYPGLLAAAAFLDVPVLGIPERDHDLDVADVVAACRRLRDGGRRLRALYVAPDFSNPSGTCLGRSARSALLAAADAEDFLVIEDGAYAFTAAPDEMLPNLLQLDEQQRVVHVGTFAKVGAPSLRVGYVVAPQVLTTTTGPTQTLARALVALKGATTVNTSPITQAIAAGLVLQHGGSIAALAREKSDFYRRQLAGLLAALEQHCGDLDGVSWNRPRGGFFVQMTVPFRADAAALRRSAEDHGVLWMPMSAFHLDPEEQCDVIRLSCSSAGSQEMSGAARRLASFLRAERDRSEPTT